MCQFQIIAVFLIVIGLRPTCRTNKKKAETEYELTDLGKAVLKEVDKVNQPAPKPKQKRKDTEAAPQPKKKSKPKPLAIEDEKKPSPLGNFLERFKKKMKEKGKGGDTDYEITDLGKAVLKELDKANQAKPKAKGLLAKPEEAA